ncbi:hypothetical protein BBJ28_00019256 [Nothophytophthora sp. Chile5]|nr:hypothetical protein BBJ28_00019256 [Nothophytophthora sp. Chile5]
MKTDVRKKQLWNDDDVEVQQFSPSPKERLAAGEKSTKTAISAGPVLVKPHVPPVVPRLQKWVASSRLVFPSHLERTADAGLAPQRGKPPRQLGSEGSTRLKVLLGTVICIYLMWTLWIIVLTIAPNATVNRIMGTERFDNGSFWLVTDTPTPLLWVAVVGLSIVSLSYVFILVKMVQKPTRIVQAPALSSRSPGTFDTMKAHVEKAFTVRAAERMGSWLGSSAAKVVVSLAQDDSLTRKRAVRSYVETTLAFSWELRYANCSPPTELHTLQQNMWLKIGELAIVTVLLFQILEAGTPVPLIAVFTTIVASNSLSCALMLCLPYEQIGLAERLVDILYVACLGMAPG